MLRPIFGIINPLFECHLAAGSCRSPSKGPWPWREKPFPSRLCSLTDRLDTVCFNCHCHSHTKPQTWSQALNLEAWLSDSEWEHCSRVHFRRETGLIVAPPAWCRSIDGHCWWIAAVSDSCLSLWGDTTGSESCEIGCETFHTGSTVAVGKWVIAVVQSIAW